MRPVFASLFTLLRSTVPELVPWLEDPLARRGRVSVDALPDGLSLRELAARAVPALEAFSSSAEGRQLLSGLPEQVWDRWSLRLQRALTDRLGEAAPMASGGGALAAGGPDQPGGGRAAAPPLQADRLMVQWSPTSTAAERRAALRAIGGQVVTTIQTGLMRDLGQGMVEVISLPPGLSLQQAIQLYQNRPGVALAEADWVVGTQAVSNDPFYTDGDRLWGMYSSDSPTAAGGSGTTNQFGSQAEQAWAQGFTGSSTVVVGVIDEGIDYRHPDLYLNIWLNQGEISTLSFFSQLTDSNGDGLITFRDLNDSRNAAFVTDGNGNGYIDAGDLLSDSRWADGIDNDGNGYRDDLIGWDFWNNTNNPFRATDGDNHGTHVAGTIGGIGGNGSGVAGVNWDVQLMPLKFLGPSGGYISGAVSAVNYYADITSRQGSTATFIGTNNSWGGGGYASTLYSAIRNGGSVGNVFVAAAGNNSANNDANPSYPSGYSTLADLGWEAVVAVASITRTGALSGFSNFGLSSVDLGAPGTDINSTVAGGGYASYSGTSMASPHVMGALALLAAAFPSATRQQLLKALFDGTAATSSLSGRTVTGGRLDIQRSIQLLQGAATYTLTPSAGSVNEGSSVTFSLTTTNVAENTTLVWKLSGTGITTADLQGGQLEGSLTVAADGTASFSVTLTADQLTEGAETLVARLYADSTSTAVLSSASVVVNDTSQAPPPPDQPRVLWGTTGSDTITGGAAGDRLAGVPSSGTRANDLGRNQIDTLIGNGGADVFLLADSRGTFYNDGNARNQGTSDYALIKDFNIAEGDKLQLRAGTQILYRNVTINGVAHTEFFLGNGDNSFTAADELIARLENRSLAPGSGVFTLGNQTWTTYV